MAAVTKPKMTTAIANVQKIRWRTVNGPSDRSDIRLTPKEMAAWPPVRLQVSSGIG